MESNASQDPIALALQIQALMANVEELTRQNQEMRVQLQQEERSYSVKLFGCRQTGNHTAT